MEENIGGLILRSENNAHTCTKITVMYKEIMNPIQNTNKSMLHFSLLHLYVILKE
jgi:hypothetical protein